jgi:hypothetical protein
MDRGKDVFEQKAIQGIAKSLGANVEMAFKDAKRSKTQYDKALISKDYSEVRFYALEFDRTPDVLCSGFFAPKRDFKNLTLQDSFDYSRLMDQCSFSIIPTDSGGAAVFCWLNNPASEAMIRSLHALDQSARPHAILRFALAVFENICLCPSWWDNLDPKAKDWANKRIMMGVFENNIDYVEDGVKVINWAQTNTHCNFAL